MVLRGQFVSLGPGACSVSAREIATWMLVTIGMVTADAASARGGVEQARTASAACGGAGRCRCRAGSSSYRPGCTASERRLAGRLRYLRQHDRAGV